MGAHKTTENCPVCGSTMKKVDVQGGGLTTVECGEVKVLPFKGALYAYVCESDEVQRHASYILVDAEVFRQAEG